MERREFRAVKNSPGIYAGPRPGHAEPDRWVVSFGVRGVGRRTRTLRSLAEAKAVKGELHTREKREELRRRDRGKVLFGDHLSGDCERRKDWAASTGAGRLVGDPAATSGRSRMRIGAPRGEPLDLLRGNADS